MAGSSAGERHVGRKSFRTGKLISDWCTSFLLGILLDFILFVEESHSGQLQFLDVSEDV